MREKVFLSGPMTGIVDFNRPAFHDAIEKLRKKGYFVISPTILPIGMEHDEYMHICYAMIDVCDIVYMLMGWQESKGALLEWKYAIEHGKRVEIQYLKGLNKFEAVE